MSQQLSHIKGPTSIPLKNVTLGKMLENSLENSPGSVVFSREQKIKLTLSEFVEKVDDFAAGLYEMGLKKGDKIGVIIHNSIELLIANFACIRGGFVLVNFNPALQPHELEYYVKILEINCFICVDKYRSINLVDVLKKVAPDFWLNFDDTSPNKKEVNVKKIIIISDVEYENAISFKNVAVSDRKILSKNQCLIQTKDVVTILFTSGSTGTPKIIPLTHHQLGNSIRFIAKRLPLLNNEAKFCFNLPLFHIFGLGFCTLCLSKGVSVILPSLYYNAEQSLKTISEEKITCVMGTPTMLTDLIRVQKDKNLLISLKYVLCGGAAGSKKLYTDILNVLKTESLKVGYGTSETAAVSWPLDENTNADFDSVGVLMDHLEAKVVNSEGGVVEMGQVGELMVKGYSIIERYLFNDTECLDEDGWFKTGDAVYLDNNNKIYITGRLKELINRGGEKISPKEIEDVLITHSNVQEVYVVGTYNERMGEEVCACVKLRPETTLTLEEIKNYCKNKLSYYKIPSRLEIMDNFPKTLLGKIQKSKLVKMLNK